MKLLQLLLVTAAVARHLAGSFSVNDVTVGSQRYLFHFACAIGDCAYKYRFRVKNAQAVVGAAGHPSIMSNMKIPLKQSLAEIARPSLFLNIFLDDDWQKSPMHSDTCDKDFQIMTQKMAKVRMQLKLDAAGDWSPWKTGQLRQTVSPHFWYFAADDCGSTLFKPLNETYNIARRYKNNLEIEYEIVMRNIDDSHLSFEQLGMPFWIRLELGFCLVVLLFYMVKQSRMASQQGGLPTVVQHVNLSLVFQLCALTGHYIHLVLLQRDGVGSFFFDTLGDVFEIGSHTTVVTAMVAVMLGISLDCRPLISNGQLALVAGLIATVQCLIVLAEKDHWVWQFRLHINEGAIGFLFCLNRLLVFVAFLGCYKAARASSKIPDRVRSFQTRFLAFSTPYFLCFPILYGITFLFPPFYQHKFLHNTLFLLQFACIVLLLEEFLSPNRSFSRVSTMAHSLLPLGIVPTRSYQKAD
ncbi:MAG: uncharacterized protein KVP18_001847 [Porospora cf. gigantea A]|uniref:uncharacterized protein n=2 Tax=Porospora cf. gigantea A TaxID=2853593 RepID=UPI00355AC489|nr:MAG: hypothetical protein KVP18_001847 [Porospora cf. gigantea A]